MHKKIGLFTALLLLSTPAFAFVDVEFYTHGAFRETVDAFKRCAMFFNVNTGAFKVLIFVFFGAGVVAALTVSAYSATTAALGGQAGSKAPVFFFTIIIGITVVSASIIPKNTLHIYDAERNQYESVGGVPAIITFAAGFTNMFAQIYREQVSISTAYPFGQLSDGSPFKLIKSATEEPSRFYGSYILRSIGTYYLDCAPIANTLGTFNLDEFKSGTESLMGELAKMHHYTIHTSYYSKASPRGEYMSCTAAIRKIQQAVNNPVVFERHLASICAELQLDAAKPNEALACKNQIADVFQTAYNVSGMNYLNSLQNVLAATAIERAIANNDNTKAMSIQANRMQAAEAAGNWTIAAQYIPALKGLLFAMILAITPFILLCCVTPLMPIALKAFFSLFLFYTIWDIMDVTVVYMFEDQLNATIKELQTAKMGVISMWSSPTASMKSLSVLGQMRSSALTLATFLTVTLFKLNAHALAGITSKVEGNLEAQGDELGKTFDLQENAGQRMTEMAHGNAAMQALRHNGGMEGYIEGESANLGKEIQTGQMLSSIDGGVTQAATGSAYGQLESGSAATNLMHDYGGGSNAASAIGASNATSSAARADAINGTNNSKAKLNANELNHLGGGAGLIEAASDTGLSIEDNASYQTKSNAIKTAEELKAFQQHDINPDAVYKAQGEKSAADKAGDLAFAQQSPHAFDTIAQSALNEATHKEGNVDALNTLAVQEGTTPKDIITSQEEDRVARDIANIQLNDGLGNTFDANPVAVAQMQSGSKQLNLNDAQLEDAYKNNLISEDAYQGGKQNKGLALDTNFNIDKDGITPNTSTARTGQAYKADDTTLIDNTMTVATGESANNVIKTMQDPQAMARITGYAARNAANDEQEKQRMTGAATQIGSEGIGQYISQRKENTSGDTKSASASAGFTTSKLFSAFTGVEASVGVEYQKTNADSRINTVDTFRSEYLQPVNNNIYDRVQDEIDSGQIPESEQAQRYGELTASHHAYLVNVANGEEESPLNQNGANPWQGEPMEMYHNWEENEFGKSSYINPNEGNEEYKPNASVRPEYQAPPSIGYGGYRPEQLSDANLTYGYGTRLYPKE